MPFRRIPPIYASHDEISLLRRAPITENLCKIPSRDRLYSSCSLKFLYSAVLIGGKRAGRDGREEHHGRIVKRMKLGLLVLWFVIGIVLFIFGLNLNELWAVWFTSFGVLISLFLNSQKSKIQQILCAGTEWNR